MMAWIEEKKIKDEQKEGRKDGRNKRRKKGKRKKEWMDKGKEGMK